MTVKDLLYHCRNSLLLAQELVGRLESAKTHPGLTFEERSLARRLKGEAESLRLTSLSFMQNFEKNLASGSLTADQEVPDEMASLGPVKRLMNFQELRLRAEDLLSRIGE